MAPRPKAVAAPTSWMDREPVRGGFADPSFVIVAGKTWGSLTVADDTHPGLGAQ